MSLGKLTPREVQLLLEVLSADAKTSDVRLREGEYQYDLVKSMASFQLELFFPNVKDIITRLYGEERADDVQFVRKIQTVLKKMEKSNVVKILPKKKPWALQRYALLSFRFNDIDKNQVILATDSQIKRAQTKLYSMLNQQESLPTIRKRNKMRVYLLALLVGALYTASVWALLQPIINLIIFVSTLFTSVVCSLVLGKLLSQT
ncbi:MAG: hypothetical protein JSV51_07025 [Candidatus Bathyarchaeota archaeon]|nr:MAG: hypothetical protein JSV51_07025 [Candidatus Bathyarchaeota archaeon]